MKKLFSVIGLRLSVSAFLFLLFSVFCPLPSTCTPLPASADEIKIRTIVTPIGSQSELGDLPKGQV
ncbi:MAG: hypothetical protein B5M48_02985 [Candidatus Omnitrophica bacterium 4484_213]|nr:MAG: hypothetical protein B5M48_02985 [Candidatus Omnitrophica bacterium 4484_213]